MMRAILISAATRTVTDFTMKDIGDSYLSNMQAAVGGYIERACSIKSGDEVFVNEEGLLHNPQHFFTVEGEHQPFAGNGVVVGHPDAEGNTLEVKINADILRNMVKFYTIEEVREMTNARSKVA